MRQLSFVDDFKHFRETVTPDLYEIDQYVGWEQVERSMREYAGAIDFVRRMQGIADPQVIAEGLGSEPYLYRVLTLLLGIEREVGFADGRDLPSARQMPIEDEGQAALLLVEIGAGRMIQHPESVEDCVRTALVAQDARRRAYQLRTKVEERLSRLVHDAVADVNSHSGTFIGILPKGDWPQAAKGRAEYVLAADGVPFAAVASVFETATGGRQTRDLTISYPGLRERLLDGDTELILIADGRGLRDAPDHVLGQLLELVPGCMTFRQAEDGGLLRAINTIRTTGMPRPGRAEVDTIIGNLLHSHGTVRVHDLPVNAATARIDLTAYVASHGEYQLELSPDSSSLQWGRKNEAACAAKLGQEFMPRAALECFAALNDTKMADALQCGDALACSIQQFSVVDTIVPEKLLVGATVSIPSVALVSEIATRALTETPESKMAVLLCPKRPETELAVTLRALQATLARNVVILDAAHLLEMARGGQTPRDYLVQQLLEQADLEKASPYVVNSVTPRRMFYGREGEAATMISTLATNSVALLGGRRIGKTSLMQHVQKQLQNAGFVPYYADCQTVRDWGGFADLARREWGAETEESFRPIHLFDLVSSLAGRQEGRTVILLDEIDQLLDWDRTHSDEDVPEAFFRVCRTLSQEGKVQFVFSGERVIANRMADSHSPHWNFCNPLMLRQLEREAAVDLMTKPLRDLRIDIRDISEFASLIWTCTSGHPQLVQFLGDALIKSLNRKAPNLRRSVSADDLRRVAYGLPYAEHYLGTYWGQSTDREKLISLWVASGVRSWADIRDRLAGGTRATADVELEGSFHMLELYGIVEAEEKEYSLRLEWFVSATGYFGGLEALVSHYWEKLNG